MTETVDPEGGLQLITKIQTAPNTTEDAAMLNATLPDLVERTWVETIYNDGAYSSPELDETCQKSNAQPRFVGLILTQTSPRQRQLKHNLKRTFLPHFYPFSATRLFTGSTQCLARVST